MPTLTEKRSALTVNAISPDGSVTAKYTQNEGLVLSFGGSGLKGHNERTLAEQVNAALKDVSIGYQKATGSTNSPPVPHSGPVERMARRYRAAVSEIDVVVTSPRGHVKARSNVQIGTQVKIRPETIHRMDVTTALLESEINTAVRQAGQRFAQEQVDLYLTHFNMDSLHKIEMRDNA